MKRHALLLPLFLILLSALRGSETWEVLNPTTTTAQIRDLAASPDRLVAVGEAGLVLTTSDGENWKPQDSGTRETFEAVAYQGGVWLAYGSSGTIFSSDDTHTWAQRTGGLGSGTFAYGNGLHVATTRDDTQQIRTSSDGYQWTDRSVLPAPSRGRATDVAFHDGYFWVSFERSLYRSADGVVWTAVTVPSIDALTRFTDLIVGNGELLLFADLRRGSDGLLYRLADDDSWPEVTAHPDSNRLTGSAYAGGKFFQIGSGPLLFHGTDLESWTPMTSPGSVNPKPRSITFAFDQWWFVSRYIHSGRLYHCTDASTWEADGQDLSLYTDGIAPLGNDLIAGNGYYLKNGTDWNSDGLTPDALASSCFTRLTSANGRAFGIDVHSVIPGTPLVEIWALDSATSGHLLATFEGTSSSDDIFYAAGRYLTSIRRNGVWIPVTSTDGETWTETTVADPSLVITDLIGAADDKFWAVVGNGSGVGDLWTSTDGVYWTFAAPTQNNALPYSIASDGQTLLVGSSNGYYFHSATDSWSYHPGPKMASVTYDGTAYRAAAIWLSWDEAALMTMAEDHTWSTQLLYRFASQPEFCRFVTLGTRTFIQSGDSLAVTTTEPDLRLKRGLPTVTDAIVNHPLVLEVVAESSGNLPLNYQWTADGVDIPDATASSLDLTVDSLENLPRTYGVKVSDGTQVVRAETQFNAYATAAPGLSLFGINNPIQTLYYSEDGYSRVDFLVIARGPGPISYQWTRNGEPIAGATGSSMSLRLNAADLGATIGLTVTNPYGSVTASTSVDGAKPVIPSPLAPTIVHNPATDTTSIYLLVYATNASWYQWRRNGVPIPGAIGDTYSRGAISPEESGFYDVVVSNAWGSTTSRSYFVTTHQARLSNLSVRAWGGDGDDTLIPGVVIARIGNDMTPLVRAIGPTLAEFGVTNPLPDPAIDVLSRDAEVLAGNDQWGGLPDYIARFNRLGAFPLPDDSLDAVSVIWDTTAPDGFSRFTVPVRSMTGESGDALVEIYDDDPGNLDGDRLINVSARAPVLSGHPLVAGFVVNGTGTARLLIRAIGPSLSSFGITEPLSRPRLRLYSHDQEVLATNTGWTENADTGTIRTTSALVGAFLLSDDSADGVLLVDLPAGRYTALIDGLEDTEGVAMVELYEVP